MKSLKTTSLFKIAFLFILNLYFKNLIVFIISLIYLFLVDKKSIIFLLSIFLVYTLAYKICLDYIPYGYVYKTSDDYFVADKIFYKVKVDSNNYVEVGDIVSFKGSGKRIDDEDLLKQNIVYLNNNYSKCHISLPYKNTLKRLDFFQDNANLFKKILFNDYVDDNNLDYYLGYGFAFYYLLQTIFRRNKYLSIVLLFVYLIFFGFETKLLLLLIDFFLSFFKLDKVAKLSLKMLAISFLNFYLFFNYSFLISLIFSLIYSTDVGNNPFVLGIIQSYYFGQVGLLSCVFHSAYTSLRIIMFLVSLIVFYCPFLLNFYLLIMKAFSFVIKIMTFGIRGKISYLTIVILFISYFLVNEYKKYILYVELIICLVFFNNPISHVSFVDVGQGDAILIKDKENTLIDTGSSYNYSKLKRELYNQGIYTIDHLIITHSDSDHSGNISALQRDFKVKEIIEDGKDVDSGNIYLQYLYVDEYDNDNDNSLIYYLSINNLSFLFTGDISKNVERELLNKYKINHIDVLKCSHHGSKTGTDSYFVSKILPRFAIISTSGLYGHPHQDTIDTLNSYLVDIFSTKEKGSIHFYFSLFNLLKTDSDVILIN